MRYFKAKMHQIRFRLGLRPRPNWGSLQHSPDPLLDLDAASRQGEGLGWGRGGKEGWEGEGGGSGGEGKGGPKLLLKQGPSETCYATVSLLFKY